MDNVVSILKMLLVWLCIIAVLNGCAVNYPIDVDPPAAERVLNQPLYYQIKKPDILTFGGQEKIEEIFMNPNLFTQVERISDGAIPPAGHAVVVKTEWRPASLASFIFGYISVSTLTLLPAWSTKDGYDIYYDYYIDGIKVKTFYYRIKRVAGMWIVLLPFAWVNLLTNSEADAFETVTYQFLNDVQPIMFQNMGQDGP